LFGEIEVEPYLLYSSMVFAVMAFTAVVLFVLIRLKLRFLVKVREVKPRFFSKRFVVFDPYTETKVFHRFIVFVVVLIWYVCFLLLYVFVKALEAGLFLPFTFLAICLVMLPLEVLPEIYRTSNIFIRAIRSDVEFGVGDVEALGILKEALSRISKYLLGLSIVFSLTALLLPEFLSTMFSLLKTVLMLLGNANVGGVVGVQILPLILAILFTAVLFLAYKMKRVALKL